MATREALLGRDVFKAFPDDPDDPDATGVANLRESLSRVLQEKRPHAMAVQRYPIRRPSSEAGSSRSVTGVLSTRRC
jgi:hypothetical protein